MLDYKGSLWARLLTPEDYCIAALWPACDCIDCTLQALYTDPPENLREVD